MCGTGRGCGRGSNWSRAFPCSVCIYMSRSRLERKIFHLRLLSSLLPFTPLSIQTAGASPQRTHRTPLQLLVLHSLECQRRLCSCVAAFRGILTGPRPLSCYTQPPREAAHICKWMNSKELGMPKWHGKESADCLNRKPEQKRRRLLWNRVLDRSIHSRSRLQQQVMNM